MDVRERIDGTGVMGTVQRGIFLVVTGVTLTWALGIIVFGAVDLASQVGSGSYRVLLYWAADQYRFTDTGDGLPGRAQIAGSGGSVVATVTGLSTGSAALHVVASIAALLPQAVLAVTAFVVSRQLVGSRTFSPAATRGIFAAALALIVAGTISQALGWIARVVAQSESGSLNYSRDVVFEPASITGGLVLLLFAFAFRMAERLQRDTEGLV